MNRPKIIAELCQNHNGSRDVLKRMVHQAAENGADFVKVQSIRAREVTFRERFEEGEVSPDGVRRSIRRPYAAELERMQRLELTLDDESWFADECLRAGVGSMTTVFTRAGVIDARDAGFEAIKLASYDCASFPLVRDVRNNWAFVVVSTGATYDHEIERAAEILRGGAFALLHCVTIYPTPISELHLRRMNWLRRFSTEVGLSDHTLVEKNGVLASKIALAMGAEWIERHFTVLGASDTKDGPVSITPTLLRELREFADRPRQERMQIVSREYPGWADALGSQQRPLSLEETLNRDYYRGRFASCVAGRHVYNWEDVDLD